MSFRAAVTEFRRGMRKTRDNTLRALAGGVTGTEVYGGYITGVDYNPAWDDDRRIDYVDEMITDPVVEATRNVIELPFKSAETTVEPGSDENIDMQIAEALTEDTVDNTELNWREIEDHVLTYLWYGHCIMWKSFEDYKGRKRWSNWGIRLPRTIEEWDITNSGHLLGVRQCAISPEGQHVDHWLTPAGRIDGQIFHIAYKQIGDNFKGVSLLRQTWRAYVGKRERILSLMRQGELAANGIPRAKYNGGIPPASDSTRTAVQTMLQTIYSGDKNYIEQSDDVEIDAYGGKDLFGFDLIPGINLLNQEIVASILATFLEQPKASVGSHAMQQSNINFFLDAIEGISNYFEHILNNGHRGMQHVRQWVALNYGDRVPDNRMPKIRKAQVNTMDLEKFASVLNMFVSAGMPITEEDWNVARTRLGFNEMEIKDIEEAINNKQEKEKTDENIQKN